MSFLSYSCRRVHFLYDPALIFSTGHSIIISKQQPLVNTWICVNQYQNAAGPTTYSDPLCGMNFYGVTMLGFFNYTVIATYMSAALAMVGLWLAFEGQPTAAVFCLLFCGLFDMFDGRIARTHKTRSPEARRYGIQIDSLADFLAFGTLPAVIGFSIWESSPAYAALAVLYMLAALIRLAYFNVTEETRQDQTEGERTHYTGLPVTTASHLSAYLVSRDPRECISPTYLPRSYSFWGFCSSRNSKSKAARKMFALLCGIGILIFILSSSQQQRHDNIHRGCRGQKGRDTYGLSLGKTYPSSASLCVCRRNPALLMSTWLSRMVDQFLQAGFTYFDTAYVYAGSEEAIKRPWLTGTRVQFPARHKAGRMAGQKRRGGKADFLHLARAHRRRLF